MTKNPGDVRSEPLTGPRPGESWEKKQRTRGESGRSGPQDTPLAARGRDSHRDEGGFFPVHG